MKRRGSMAVKVSFMAIGVGFALWRGSVFMGQLDSIQGEGGLGALSGLGSLSELQNGLGALSGAEKQAQAESSKEFVVYSATGETIDAASSDEARKLLAHATQMRPSVPSQSVAKADSEGKPESLIRVRKKDAAESEPETESALGDLETVVGLLEGLSGSKK